MVSRMDGSMFERYYFSLKSQKNDSFTVKIRKKSDLPTKLCLVCGRPFAWRKKWEGCWEDVKYCSERCRRARANPQKNNVM